MSLRVLDASDPLFEQLYEQFVRSAGGATFWYLPRWREYQAVYCDTSFAADRSFVIIDGETVVAACPVIVEQENGISRIAIRNSYGVAPIVSGEVARKTQRRVETLAFETLDNIAGSSLAAKAMLMVPFNGEGTLVSPFAERRFLDASTSTHATDLSPTLPELWSGVRGSYHSIINKAKRALRIVVIDAQNPSLELHEAYRKLHHKAAGRVTRPLRTFELQYEMLREDNAMLVAVMHGDTPIACTYFHHHRGVAYLASIADDHDFDAGVALEHAVIWTGIEYYKTRGFRFLELGYQHYGPQLFEQYSAKESSISFFKRGFPGRSYYIPRGVRFYDGDLARSELAAAAEQLQADVEAQSRSVHAAT